MPAAENEHVDAGVEKIYEQIGNYIVEIIDDDWTEASIHMELGTGHGRGYGRYRKEGVDAVLPFRLRYDVYKLFKELRIRLQKEGTRPWVRATFRLKRDAKFEIDFEYEDSL